MNSNLHPVFAQALAPFMPRVIQAAVGLPNLTTDPSLLKGLVEYQYETDLGIFVDCYLEYEEGFDGGTGPDSDESYPERITLMYALVNGVDVTELMEDGEHKQIIEEEALAAMKTDAFERECDLGEDRWNDMREVA